MVQDSEEFKDTILGSLEREGAGREKRGQDHPGVELLGPIAEGAAESKLCGGVVVGA